MYWLQFFRVINDYYKAAFSLTRSHAFDRVSENAL